MSWSQTIHVLQHGTEQEPRIPSEVQTDSKPLHEQLCLTRGNGQDAKPLRPISHVGYQSNSEDTRPRVLQWLVPAARECCLHPPPPFSPNHSLTFPSLPTPPLTSSAADFMHCEWLRRTGLNSSAQANRQELPIVQSQTVRVALGAGRSLSLTGSQPVLCGRVRFGAPMRSERTVFPGTHRRMGHRRRVTADLSRRSLRLNERLVQLPKHGGIGPSHPTAAPITNLTPNHTLLPLISS